MTINAFIKKKNKASVLSSMKLSRILRGTVITSRETHIISGCRWVSQLQKDDGRFVWWINLSRPTTHFDSPKNLHLEIIYQVWCLFWTPVHLVQPTSCERFESFALDLSEAKENLREIEVEGKMTALKYIFVKLRKCYLSPAKTSNCKPSALKDKHTWASFNMCLISPSI